MGFLLVFYIDLLVISPINKLVLEKMERSSNNYVLGLFFLLLLLGGSVAVILTPFTIYRYEVAGDDYEFRTFFFGHWDRWKNGDLVGEGGIENLDNFPVVSTILIFIGLISNFIFSLALGTVINNSHSYYNKHRRIFGILLLCSSFIGLVGTLLQISYLNYLRSFNTETILHSGFLIATIIFSIFIIAGLPTTIVPDAFARTDSIVEQNRKEILNH